MAIGVGGSFITQPLTPHSLTNIEVIELLLPRAHHDRGALRKDRESGRRCMTFNVVTHTNS